jgi:hypothetical protein
MTKALSFTQAGVRRAIAAAKASGLRVVAVRADGTVLVWPANEPLPEVYSPSVGFDHTEATPWWESTRV